MPPKNLPDLAGYDIIACTNGAYLYLKELNFPFEKLNFISGDFDSHCHSELVGESFEIIETPDQNKTDFEKALDILQTKGVKKVDVYGGSGGEMDHFLGNLTSAFQFKNEMEIRFFDEFSTYYFIPNSFELNEVKGKMISLYPFPSAEKMTTQGLNWELNGETLNMTSRIGTRNFAKENKISIRYGKGDLLIFIGKDYSL